MDDCNQRDWIYSHRITVLTYFPSRIKAFMSNSVGYTSQVAAPRVIKTHLPIELLPKDILKAKILWVARNPKDTLLSFFNHEKLLPVHGLREDAFDEFFANFLKGQTLYGDYWNFMKVRRS